mmetsp:Transcript_23997/g.70787  ORF Transcript_23997/g.70787 Transcript_23997/m.70787 type:complete len:407 (-) Transcript_23997:59-1279(-)
MGDDDFPFDLFGKDVEDDHIMTRCLSELGGSCIDESDLHAVSRRIALSPSVGRDRGEVEEEIKYKTGLVERHMGSMAQCRGKQAEILREAGAVDALFRALDGLIDGIWDGDNVGALLPTVSTSEEVIDAAEYASVDFAIVCFGAVRDLACGNARNRAAINALSDDLTSNESPILTDRTGSTGRRDGISILSEYLRRYHLLTWKDILNLPGTSFASDSSRGQKELRLLTNVVGAIRNATHSTPRTCVSLHELSVTDMMIWKLKFGEGSHRGNTGVADVHANDHLLHLPDTRKPWREACYRIAGSLINMSEKCNACSERCGTDIDLVFLLVEAWGGKINDSASTPPLHLGLAAILRSTEKRMRLDGGLNKDLIRILEKEEERRKSAQEKEKNRKKSLKQHLCIDTHNT